MLKDLHLYLEITCLCIALLLWRDLKRNTLMFYFIPFLIVTVLVEISAKWLWKERNEKFILFNIFTAAEFVFYSLIFRYHLSNRLLRSIIIILIPTYLLLFILNVSFLQGLSSSFHSYTFLLGSFFMVVYSCFFLYESILPESINIRLSHQPFFWISIGLLIFYLGSVIINALVEYLTKSDFQQQGIIIYQNITNSLNVILYGSFSIAFILCRNNRKTSSSPSL
jgi:hypothetical protein